MFGLFGCILWQINPSRLFNTSDIGIIVRVFANGPGDWVQSQVGVIPKTEKMVIDDSLLNNQHYNLQIKGKVDQSWERSSAFPWCCSYQKGSLQVTLNYGRQLYFTIYIYVCVCVCVCVCDF